MCDVIFTNPILTTQKKVNGMSGRRYIISLVINNTSHLLFPRAKLQTTTEQPTDRPSKGWKRRQLGCLLAIYAIAAVESGENELK